MNDVKNMKKFAVSMFLLVFLGVIFVKKFDIFQKWQGADYEVKSVKEAESACGSSSEAAGKSADLANSTGLGIVHLRHVDIPEHQIAKAGENDGAGDNVYVSGHVMNLSLPGKLAKGYLWNPSKNLLVAEYGEYDPIIYTEKGNKVAELSYPEGRMTAWKWLNDKELVGVRIGEDVSLPHPSTGSEQMLVASSVKFYIYRIDKSPHLFQIELPPTKFGHFVQLEGVTPDGDLILSSTQADLYDQGGFQEFLGVYKIDRSSE